MLTYQIRKRFFRLHDGGTLTFPNEAEMIFKFEPLQAFGLEPGNGKTCVRGIGARLLFNQITGQHTIQSERPLNPLEVKVEESDIREVLLQGNVLTVRTRAQSLDDLDQLIQSVFFVFPILLGVEFADPPVITDVRGKVGEIGFTWELTDWQVAFETTTQDEQEDKVVSSWMRFNIVGEPSSRRLVAALHYFHVACRLSRVGNAPWEFMGEAILNFSKILEVLFPSQGEGKTIDASREGLGQLDFSASEIERDFIPAIALRNGMDVGHVHLSLLSQPQLQILHNYTDAAEQAFRKLLRRVLDRVPDGSYVITPYTASNAGPEVAQIIDRLGQYFSQ